MTNPLQALFNCIVYKRWRTGDKVRIPWKSKPRASTAEEPHELTRTPPHIEEEERMYLLQSAPKSINGYKTYND